jgi:hypothetical protein
MTGQPVACSYNAQATGQMPTLPRMSNVQQIYPGSVTGGSSWNVPNAAGMQQVQTRPGGPVNEMNGQRLAVGVPVEAAVNDPSQIPEAESSDSTTQ